MATSNIIPRKRRRRLSTDHSLSAIQGEPPVAEARRQATMHQETEMPLDARKPVGKANGAQPKRQGLNSLSPDDSAYNNARGGKASGNPDAKQGRKSAKNPRPSRHFDECSLKKKDANFDPDPDPDPTDKPQDKFSEFEQQPRQQQQQQHHQHHQQSQRATERQTPASLSSHLAPLYPQLQHLRPSSSPPVYPSPTPPAGKLNSKERSVSYTSPLDLFGDSKLKSGRAAPLTEQNLRSHLRSLDSSSPSSSPLPSPSAAAAGRNYHRSPGSFGEGFAAPPPQPAAFEPASVPTIPTHTAATSDFRNYSTFSTGMRKSKSPKKHDKDRDKDKKKSKQHDPDTHPLNLPPDQLRQLFRAQMAGQEAEAANNLRSSMSVDRDTPDTSDKPVINGSSPPATPSKEAPGAFPEHPSDNSTNGTNGSDERSPTPPPHRVPPPKVDPEACKAAGNKFFKAKDYERAIAEYTKAVDAEPSNPTYLSNRAAAYISANKYSQALGDSLLASRLDPKNDKILHRLARIYTSLGRPQDALDTYAKIPNASATDTAAARKALQSIDMAENQINSEGGNGNMALWSIDQAKQTLGAGTPTPRRWQVLRAKANLKIGTANALGEVQGIAQNLMRENSMDAEAIVLAGRAFYLKDDKPRQGKSDYERAEDYFRQALSLDPDNSDARNSLRTMKKLDRARTSANDMFKRGKYSDAVAAYTDALTIDSSNKVTNAKLLGNRALARIKIKEYEEARSDCDLALKLDPSYTKAKRTRAKATGESGDWDQAVKDLKAMLEENPSDAELNKELRNAELELKKSKRKDWYKILGVDKDAGDKEIERAYKRKAAVLHPDKTMGDKKKEEEFKDCLEAKETLLDPQKRHMYDSGADLMEPGMGGMGGFPGGMGGFGGMGGGGGVQIDPEMLFNMMNGMGGAGGGGGGGFRFATGGGGRGGFSPFG